MFELDTAGTVFLRLSPSRIGNEFDKLQMLEKFYFFNYATISCFGRLTFSCVGRLVLF